MAGALGKPIGKRRDAREVRFDNRSRMRRPTQFRWIATVIVNGASDEIIDETLKRVRPRRLQGIAVSREVIK